MSSLRSSPLQSKYFRARRISVRFNSTLQMITFNHLTSGEYIIYYITESKYSLTSSHRQVEKNVEKEGGAVKQCDVRGLRRCCSTVCSRASFKDRDSVGARNILRCFLERERPKSLSRNPGEAKLEMEVFTLRPRPRNRCGRQRGGRGS